MAKRRLKPKKAKNRVQVFNPRSKRWVKVDTKRGGIVGHKKSPGPYKNVKKRRR